LFSDNGAPPIKKRKGTKPYRMCPLCEKRFGDFQRHLLRSGKHKDHPRIKPIVDAMKAETITKAERNEKVAHFRKEGILLANKKLLSGTVINPDSLESMRKCSGPKVKCSECCGLYHEEYFWKHRQKCGRKSGTTPKATSVTSSTNIKTFAEKRDQEWQDFLSAMKQDQFYDIIKGDEMIQRLGKEILAGGNSNKKKETTVKSRTLMRRLARLLHISELPKCSDLFHIDNYGKMEDSVNILCKGKPGLRVGTGNILKSACKILRPLFILGHDDNATEQLDLFEKVLTSPVQYAKIFGEAALELREKSQRESRKPISLPNENDYQILWQHLETEAESIMKNGIHTRADFVRARRVCHSILTLLNGRRGSEVSLVKIKDWFERDTWLNENFIDPEVEEILKDYSVTYVFGKSRKDGEALVPVLFVNKLGKALDMLADSKIRQMAGVACSNDNLFPFTESSEFACVGFNELDAICKDIGIPTISATPVRHRASTFMWNLKLPDADANKFFKHIGHNKATDVSVYACPEAHQTLKTMAPILETIKSVSSFKIVFPPPFSPGKFQGQGYLCYVKRICTILHTVNFSQSNKCMRWQQNNLLFYCAVKNSCMTSKLFVYKWNLNPL